MKIRIYIVFFVLISASCSDPQKRLPGIENGFLDLSSWNFEEDGLVDLNGEWEFYWDKLLDPENFKSTDSLKAEYINVPGGWAAKSSGQKSYPDLGCATYRLRIKVPDRDTDYNLIFSSIFASARMWVNGSLCFEKGKVASSKDESRSVFITEYFTPIKYDNNRDTLEIIIQVADFHYGGPASGIRRKVTFGPVEQISAERIEEASVNSALLGILLLISLYHIFLFLYRRNEPSYLIFALLSIVVAFWTIYGSGMFAESFSYKIYFLIGFTGPAFFPALLALFYYFIYKDEVHKIAVYAFLIIATVFMGTFIISSTTTMSKILTVFSMNMLIPPTYLLAYSLLKALLRKRKGSVLSYLGVLIMYASVMHDAFLANGFITGFGDYISSQGFVALIILQSLVLAQMFSGTFKDNISLNLNLKELNLHLEEKVKKRTRTIAEQKDEIEAQRDDLKEQRDTVMSQKNEIIESMNYAQRIQMAMLPPEPYFIELLDEAFILFEPKEIISGDFYWIKQVHQFIILVAADCTGHGIPGALMSMLGMSYLNEIVQRREVTTPGQVLNELRDQVKRTLRQHGQPDESKDGIEMAICVLDKGKRILKYSGAYNPLYLIQDENGEAKLNEIKADRMPIGYYEGRDKPFTSHEMKLAIGDTFYIFSDGFIDQKGGKENRKFMSTNFKKLLLKIHERPMYEQKIILEKTLEDWRDGQSQMDDILVIGVRV